MDSYKIIRDISDDVKINKHIINWSLTEERFLNVITIPYNSPVIFIDIILKYASAGKKILYITNEMEAYIKIVDCLQKHTDFRDYAYLRRGKSIISIPMVISSHENALRFNGIYDLIIYDDINCVPEYNKKAIKDLVLSRSGSRSKMIAFSLEDIFENAKEIRLPVRGDRKPFIEPRIITTRINIGKNIPRVIYDYIKWLIHSERKVIIYVPDSEKVYKTYQYINNTCRKICSNIMYYHKGKTEQRVLINFSKQKCSILITNDYECEYFLSDRCAIMVYYCDNPFFDYKKLVYFCGKAGWVENSANGEVIFLANNETKDMERAKNLARKFNKEAWELGLLDI